MNISDEIYDQAAMASFSSLVNSGSQVRAKRAGFTVIAEWARREALAEAAVIAEHFDRGNVTEHFKPLDVQARTIAAAIRLFADGDTP